MAKVSDSDLQEIQEVVGIFDKVGDGKVDINDIVNILRSLGKLLNWLLYILKSVSYTKALVRGVQQYEYSFFLLYEANE